MPSTEWIIEMIVSYGGKLLLAIIVLVVGLWLIGRFIRMLRLLFERKEIDLMLQKFLLQVIGITFKILLIISVVSMVGVQMTSFIAILGAAGLAFGMALSGTLQNFAGGVILLMLKPFKVGDFIEAQGFAGTVQEIQIFHTVLITPDKKRITIPNGNLSNSSMTNFSSESIRRVEWTFGISYSDSIEKAKNIINTVITADERVHTNPEPFIGVVSLGDSSVNIIARVWVDTPNFWPVFFKMNEEVKNAFDSQGISIPFPQTDVHIHKH